MRKTSVLALALTLAAVSASAADYAGHWTLDKVRSTGLPPYYDQITSHELTITKNAKELAVGVTVKAPDRDPDVYDLRYKLDGSPTKTEMNMRTPNGPRLVPTVLSMKKDENGDVVITIERDLLRGNGEVFKAMTVENWHLDADGKTLTIDRSDDMPRGKTESKMVFLRQ